MGARHVNHPVAEQYRRTRMLTVRRLFWTVMLVGHLVALHAAWFAALSAAESDLTGPGVFRILGLACSAAFFALKIADVRWLRLLPGWRSLVASSVAVALLHVSVVQRAVDADVRVSPAPLGVVLFVSTCVDFDAVRRAYRRLAPGQIPLRRLRHGHFLGELLARRVWDAGIEPVVLDLVPIHRAPRAPPA